MKKILRNNLFEDILKCRIILNSYEENIDFIDNYTFSKDYKKNFYLALKDYYSNVTNGFLSEVYYLLHYEQVEIIGDNAILQQIYNYKSDKYETYNKPFFKCPCCKYRTLDELGVSNICPYCWWENEERKELAINCSKIIKNNPNYYYREKFLTKNVVNISTKHNTPDTDKYMREEIITFFVKCRLIFNTLNKKKILFDLEKYYNGVTNGYLVDLYEIITGRDIEIIGEVKDLIKCECCKYKTLETKNQICKNCNFNPLVDDITKNRKVMIKNPNYYKEKFLK